MTRNDIRMDEKTARLYLEAYKAEYISQEVLNKEFQTKTLGISAFGTALLGAGLAICDSATLDFLGWLIAAFLGLSFIALLVHAGKILLTGYWRTPVGVDDVKKEAQSSPEWFEEWIGDGYQKAVAKNSPRLKLKSKIINRMIAFAFVETSFFFVFTLYTLWLTANSQ